MDLKGQRVKGVSDHEPAPLTPPCAQACKELPWWTSSATSYNRLFHSVTQIHFLPLKHFPLTIGDRNLRQELYRVRERKLASVCPTLVAHTLVGM